ncbi:hypothetical protein CSU32_06420 [Salmonella enterica subsp. diarizonae]|nr:hypothetical protein [Salmonella enterica subsp. diarizonae]ECI3361270.1 hypothetical protein [Salmonella enterica subsp. diarizonae]
MNRGRYGQDHRYSGLQISIYFGCQKYGITAEKKLAIHGELLTLQSGLMMQHFVNYLIRL